MDRSVSSIIPSNPFLAQALRAVRPLLDDLPANVPTSLRIGAEIVRERAARLAHPSRQVAVTGWTGVGKSSLINAMVGAPLLPTRRRDRAHAIVRIGYGDVPAIVSPGGDIPFDRAAEVIAAAESEIALQVPLPLLRYGWEIVDTPGFGWDIETDERSERALHDADLVIAVLAADKLLSVRERETITRLNARLHGNVTSVVNRMDAVEAEEREDVLAWAGGALRQTGNLLAGTPPLFGLSARSHHDENVAAFRTWLTALLGNRKGERVSALARLAALEHALAGLHETCATASAVATVRLEAARQERAREGEGIRAGQIQILAEARTWVRAYRGRLTAPEETFMAAAVAASAPADRGMIALGWETAAREYLDTAEEEIALACGHAPLTLPALDMPTMPVITTVIPPRHLSRELTTNAGDLLDRLTEGRAAGRGAGDQIGRWIERSVFNLDTDAETSRLLTARAREVFTVLRRHVEAHLDRLEGLLASAVEYYGQWNPSSPAVTAAEQEVAAVESLQARAGRALEDIRGLIDLLLAG